MPDDVFKRARELPVAQRSKLINKIDLEYGSMDWRNKPEYVQRFSKKVDAALARNKKGPTTMPSLEDKAANRNLGETPKSKMAQSEMADVPRQTLVEEMSKGDPKLAAELEKQQLSTAEKMALERRAGVERRIIEGSSTEGPERRIANQRRQGIEEIKRLKGEVAADVARQAHPGGRDTLVRNVPKIQERIAGARQNLIETASGPSSRLSGLARAGKLGGKALGVAGAVVNIPEHWRAVNAVETEENKDAPWLDKFSAYTERVLGFEPGMSGRAALPSEARAARSL